MIRITDILEEGQKYLSQKDLEMIEKAYIFSASVHQGQLRLSGEPYLIHPLEVTQILLEMRLDTATLITGLLHDTVEDTLTTIEQINEAFGKDVAFLVDGLTKISKITFGNQMERQAENFRKMLLAMSSDIRILLIKLADRLHNMRTLEFHSPDRQKFVAQETLEVYAPLAARLGINWIKDELEDLSLKYLHPDGYYELMERIDKNREERDQYTEEVRDIICRQVESFGLKGQVRGRAKHFYSIFKKMHEQRLNFDEVYDLTAFRIILDSEEERKCYEVLSVIHALWKPVPGRFKDYIAMPKANNYRSLHTTVIGPYGERVEIQIRTKEMDEWADKGIAAHWRYKEGKVSSGKDEDQIDKLRELLEGQAEHQNAREFMKNLKLALYPDEVYVFTPKGDVKSFPKGATPIDFAYSIHTDVGNQCIGAKVNRSIVPLKYKLQNGDTVDVMTQSGHYPSKDWLKCAVTSRAISKIRQWIKTEEREESIDLGRDLIEKELKRHFLKLSEMVKTDKFSAILEEHSLSSVDDLLALVGYGKMSARHVANQVLHDDVEKNDEKMGILDMVKQKFRKAPSDMGISITGINDIMVRFAKCCSPLPGDDIVGCVTRGRGITIHGSDCPMVKEMDPERIIEAQWNVNDEQTFPVAIRATCKDKKGLLSELSNVIYSMGINTTYVNIDATPGSYAICDFQLDIKNLKQLNLILSELKKLKSVLLVERLKEHFHSAYKNGTHENIDIRH
ncbi:MAG: bifunctional (p)ppGpp synthetase/guanosine-3',5'-bis(diphosphate) 3'-pyrophosphohydrolase [Thermodesulfobacteriota bacterium]|nr:bifunctional (p)ppGpp synthetase/guanosine-3',5'-bis(diphosphate) 3'-pyrophosphohydrolase [Thermodesulfobacteriota bacterium]